MTRIARWRDEGAVAEPGSGRRRARAKLKRALYRDVALRVAAARGARADRGRARAQPVRQRYAPLLCVFLAREKASRRVLIPGTNESYGRFCGRLTAPLTDRKTFHASRRQTATAPPATGSCVAPRWTAPRRDPSEAS